MKRALITPVRWKPDYPRVELNIVFGLVCPEELNEKGVPLDFSVVCMNGMDILIKCSENIKNKLRRFNHYPVKILGFLVKTKKGRTVIIAKKVKRIKMETFKKMRSKDSIVTLDCRTSNPREVKPSDLLTEVLNIKIDKE